MTSITGSKIGYIEAKMNSLIFKPPDRTKIKQKGKCPKYIQKIECKNCDNDDIELTYFVIHPNEVRHARHSEQHKAKKKSNPPYILWSHGNGCDLIESYSSAKAVHSRLGGHVGIIMYDYEGYGLSSGECREDNCYHDLKTMVDLCIDTLRIPKSRLFLLGHSLGTGIVVDYVSKNEWETPIILLSPYKTISRVMVDPHHMDLFTNFIVNSMDRFCSIDKIGKIDTPIIIYHGIKDDLIFYKHSLDLKKTNSKHITLVLLKKAGHNDILAHIEMKQIWNIIFNHINKY